MIGAHIRDGDLVCIRIQPDVDDGQIAAVLIGEEATLKRVYHREDGVMLVAENPAFPIFDDIDRLNSPGWSPPSPEEQAAWDAEAIARSNAFQKQLQAEFDRIQWDAIQKIQPGEPEPLTDIEALFLDYIDNRSTSPFKVGGY